MAKPMAKAHRDTEERYSILRKEALKAAQDIVREQYPHLSLTLITSEAIQASKAWHSNPNRRVNWGWHDPTEGYPYLKFKHPKRFESATWYKNKLAGLTFGRPTFNASSLRLDFIEKAPDAGKEVGLLEVSLIAMGTYAELLGAHSIRIMNPINSDVRSYYESCGFKYHSDGDYCEGSLFS